MGTSTMCHHPVPSGTGRYSVVQPHQFGDVEGLGRRSAVRAEVASPEAHEHDLATAGPASAGRARAPGGVEPDGWVMSVRSSTHGLRDALRALG